MASDDFTVNEDGWIQENGQNVAQIGIAFADNAYELVKSGEGFYIQ